MLQNIEIDYKLLGKAKEYYSKINYKYIELPWFIPLTQMLYTTTSDKVFSTTYDENFVGSAEQSFIYYALNNKLIDKTYYQSITPCFRRDELDETHSTQFIKLELFYYCPSYEIDDHDNFIKNRLNIDSIVKKILFDVDKFVRDTTFDKVEIINNSKSNYDLELNAIEIGSYGYRCSDKFYWFYGTGLALPRFTYAINKK